MTRAAGDRFGGYEIVGPLGQGGMGEVFRARDSRLHRDVAIKFLPSAFTTDRDRVEGRVAVRFSQPFQILFRSMLDRFGTPAADGAP